MSIDSIYTRKLPAKSQQRLILDAAQRDRTTARRLALLQILWGERYLTREQLIVRVETRLGRKCFGARAWKDTFSRDMRFVRSAFAEAGHSLAYSRTKTKTGYYLKGEGILHEEIVQAIAGSVAEVDLAQITIYRRLTSAQRFRQGSSITDLTHQMSKRTRELHV